MKHALQLGLLSLVLSAAGLAHAQINGGPPLPPLPASPVQTFRMLLTTNTIGRAQWLSFRKPEQCQHIEAKIKEYEALPPAEREARLQTLQLRWYLPLLMQMKAPERAQQLARIPQPDRALLETKLKTWDIMPPPLKQDLIENQQAISIFIAPVPGGADGSVLRALSPERQEELRRQFERLNGLPDARRAQILASFQNFFALPATEQGRALRTLTAAERAGMELTLNTFVILPPPLRQQAVDGFKKFADLTPAERAAFLQTAERWQAMSETERERWRKIVAGLQAQRVLSSPPHPAKHTSGPLVGKSN